MIVLQRHLRVITPRRACSIVICAPPVRCRPYTVCDLAHNNSLRHFPFASSRFSAAQRQKRGKKTKATTRVEDLPPPPFPLEPVSVEDDVPAYPTVVLQARSNMRKFENCVLLTRVGGFYELYFEHADEFGPLMNLKVAQKRTSAGPVSMVVPPSCNIIFDMPSS